LEDRESKNNKVFRGVWEAVETEAEKARIAKAEGRREERRSRKEKRKR